MVIKGWIATPIPRSQFARARATLKSGVFDDDECFDLCPTESQPTSTSHQPPEPETTAYSVLDDQQQLAATTAPSMIEKDQPNVLTAQELEFKVERDRIRLEMAYELFESKDDCDLEDISTCASQCDDCHGVGTTRCRFCAGTKSISHILHHHHHHGGGIGNGGNSMQCPVCNEKGVEVCSKCRGSGQVASWTDLAKFNPGKV